MIDQISLFLHVLAAVGLVGGGLMQVLVGSRLRAATTPTSIATWGTFALTASTLVLFSGVVSLLTGGHLAGAVWTTEARSGFSHPFITLGVVGLLVAGGVWWLATSRLRRLVERTRGEDVARLDADRRSSALWGPVHGLVGIGVGLIWVMTGKPGWVATAVVLLGSLVLGWIAGLLVSTRA